MKHVQVNHYTQHFGGGTLTGRGGRERKRVYKPEDDNPETYLKAIKKAKLDANPSQLFS